MSRREISSFFCRKKNCKSLQFTLIELLVVIAIIAILAGTPVGSTIVAVDASAFILFSGIGCLIGGIHK